MRALKINDETWMLTSAIPIPLVGVLPVNAYVVLGEQPTVIDTGTSPDRETYVTALKEIVDPSELRWIVVTHSDPDHTGALGQLMRDAPQARIATAFITVGIMGVTADPIPPERALLVHDGDTLDLGDRTLSASRPPLFDNPGTLAFFDPKQDVLFAADCFGAPLAALDAVMVDDIGALPAGDVADAQLRWGSIDSPWAHFVEEARLAENLRRFVHTQPATVLSSHLPPIRGGLDRHVETLSKLPSSTPWVAPDQAALEAAMAQMGGH
jgi:hypothetical protein